MDISDIAFVLMALISGLFLAVIAAGEWDLKLPGPPQFGDSSLSPSSVNWLGGMAFLGAVLICLMI
jgi:hypothetical protein